MLFSVPMVLVQLEAKGLNELAQITIPTKHCHERDSFMNGQRAFQKMETCELKK